MTVDLVVHIFVVVDFVIIVVELYSFKLFLLNIICQIIAPLKYYHFLDFSNIN